MKRWLSSEKLVAPKRDNIHFVERIEVFQPEKIPGTRTKKQTIAIIWNFIGAVNIPEEARKTA